MHGQNRRGAAGQQYAIIVGLVGAVAILAVASMGSGIKALMTNTANTLTGVQNATGSNGAGQGQQQAQGELYPFTSHTFTSCGANHRNGPPINDCRTAYGTGWPANTTWFKQGPFAGYQQWMVPKTGVYQLVAIGANGSATGTSGYAGGLGASITVEMPLTQGEELVIVVGQSSTTVHAHDGAAGGGTYVARSGFFQSSSDADLIVVAGGGANGNYDIMTSSIRDASLTTAGKNGQGFNAGTGGGGGGGGSGSPGAGGGGAGVRGDGVLISANGAVTGLSFLNGATGGWGYYSHPSGFGGGGAGGNYGGAGGGGYNGGGAGDQNSRVAGGGSSFWNSGATLTASALRASGNGANGSLAISYLRP